MVEAGVVEKLPPERIPDGHRAPKQKIFLYGNIQDLDRHVSDLVAAGHTVEYFSHTPFGDADVYMSVSSGHTHYGCHSVHVGIVYWKHHGPAFLFEEPVGAWDGF